MVHGHIIQSRLYTMVSANSRMDRLFPLMYDERG